MWIMTVTGFVSAVEKAEDVARGTLTVRARDSRSLSEFGVAAGRKPRQYKTKMVTDYPYRAVFTREEVAQAVVTLVAQIDYSNFKTEAKRRRGKAYAHALGEVWWAMRDLTPKKVSARLNRGWSSSSYSASSALPAKSRWSSDGSWGDAFAAAAAADNTLGLDDLLDELDEIENRRGKRLHEMTEAEWQDYLLQMDESLEG